jgi:hypothetical protein
MGDRANVCVRQNESDSGVYLYTHWTGYSLPNQLQGALAKRWRWDDAQYLTRIIFDAMTEDSHGQETGYGITSQVWDGDGRVLVVDCESQTVRCGNKSWSFTDYIALNSEQIDEVWRN